MNRDYKNRTYKCVGKEAQHDINRATSRFDFRSAIWAVGVNLNNALADVRWNREHFGRDLGLCGILWGHRESEVTRPVVAVVVVVVVWLQAVTGAGAPGNTAAPDAVPLIGQKVGGTAYQKCACGWLL